jgi:hypothetical protein
MYSRSLLGSNNAVETTMQSSDRARTRSATEGSMTGLLKYMWNNLTYRPGARSEAGRETMRSLHR